MRKKDRERREREREKAFVNIFHKTSGLFLYFTNNGKGKQNYISASNAP